MKYIRIYWFFIALFFSSGSWAESSDSPLRYLQSMVNAHRQLNYEQFYIFQQGEEIESWRYRHAQLDGKEFAQLLSLDGVRSEIILQENRVGYLGDFQTFSIQTDRILDNLPAVLYADFTNLVGYSFLDHGRERVANRVSRVIRIVPNDEFRYQYTLWIDEENRLLLKSELLDSDRKVLEQFRVVQSHVNSEVVNIIEPILSLALPNDIQPPAQHDTLSWTAKWLPKGFQMVKGGRDSFAGILSEEQIIESRLYSDGLFSFSVYAVQGSTMTVDDKFWRDGKTSIYSQTVGDKEMIVIGEIPLAAARHIVQEIEQNRPLVKEQTK